MNEKIKPHFTIILLLFAFISFIEMVYNTHLATGTLSGSLVELGSGSMNAIGYGIMFLICLTISILIWTDENYE